LLTAKLYLDNLRRPDIFADMEIRKAKVTDAGTINSLISEYAERDIMLHRSHSDIYKNLQAFTVAELDGEVVGCCALEVIWSDLAEIKSLAVHKNNTSSGIGSALVKSTLEQAGRLGIHKLFALTLDPQFFVKFGFEKVEKKALPMKVWSDCAGCPKQDHCDEIAVIKKL